MKNVFITGASGAIGAACCRAFLSKGCNVAALYLKNEEGAKALQSCAVSSKLVVIRADVTESSQVRSAFQEAKEALGGIDTVVNCAGIAQSSVIQDTTDDALSALVDTNIKGTFYVCREAAGYMVSQHSGSIINISSMWGEVGASCEACYSMTKAAIIGLTKALAKELGPSGIRVNCITPGLIDTPMNSCYLPEELAAIADETPLMRMGTGDDVAGAVLYLAGEESSFITGQILGVNGGYVI